MMEIQFPSFAILFTLLLFVFVVISKGKRSNSNSTSKLIPGPRKLPIIGNMHQLIGFLPHQRLRDLAQRYGSLMHLKLGEVSTVVVSSPETAKQVMKTHDIIFATRPHMLAAGVMTYGYKDIAFAPYGEYWRQLRKICVIELLSAKRVLSFRSVREEEVSSLIQFISSNAGLPINLSEKVFFMTYSIVSRAAFGKNYNGQEEFMRHLKESKSVGGAFRVADMFPSQKWLLAVNRMKSRLENVHKNIDRILQNVIDEHKARKETIEAGEVEPADEDLVDVLLDVEKNGTLEFSLTDENIKAVILDIFTGGTETSSATVEWAMAEMLKNPGVMEKAQTEVRQVFGRKGNVDEAGLQELVYLKMVVKETLRLHPPVPLLIPRECREKCEINGHDIAAKSRVIVNAWAIGRDPQHWTEADRFRPERFVDSVIDFKGSNFEYIPFGGGRRICPGIVFAMANVELPLAQLLYHFDWQLHGGTKPEDLDMTEAFGFTVRRQNALHLLPVPYPLI